MRAASSYLKMFGRGRDQLEPTHAGRGAIALLHRHMTQVLAETDCAVRRSVLCEIYLPNCFIAGPDEALGCGFVDRTRYGYAAINDVARRLQKHRPGYHFDLDDAVADESGVASLRWLFGPAEGPPEHVGIEIALCSAGRIEACFSILDDAAAPLDLQRVCAFLAPSSSDTEHRGHQAWVRETLQYVATAHA